MFVTPAASASDMQVVLVFLLGAIATLTLLADNYTTMIGLQHGFVEGNPLIKWLFKKVGTSLTAFITGSVILIFGAWMTTYGVEYTDLYFGIVAAGEGIRSFLNYRKLKAAKISLK